LTAVRSWLEEARAWAEALLERRVPPADAHPAALHTALRYTLFGGGKRLRPALVRLVCTELGGDLADAEAPAAAIELVHTYSLVHDDLPCMDDDDLRRGRPTCHVAFGEALAVLVGDALQTLAFEQLATVGGERAGELAAVLARAAGPAGMVGGQVLDLASADGPADLASVADIHLHKTAALFGAATEMGAVAAGTGAERRARARAWGLALGRLFQATDDVLDVTGEAEDLGKTPGKDARLEKGTLVAVLGLEGARAEAERLESEARRLAGELGWGPGDVPLELVELMARRRS